MEPIIIPHLKEVEKNKLWKLWANIMIELLNQKMN